MDFGNVMAKLRNLFSFLMVTIKHHQPALFLMGNKASHTYCRKSKSFSCSLVMRGEEKGSGGKTQRGEEWEIGKDARSDHRGGREKRR